MGLWFRVRVMAKVRVRVGVLVLFRFLGLGFRICDLIKLRYCLDFGILGFGIRIDGRVGFRLFFRFSIWA